MNVHNMMEEHVFQRVNELYDHLKEESPAWLNCGCENCRLDTSCYVLNRIPPRYIVSGRGVTHVQAGHAVDQLRADIDALAIEGIRLVSAAKRPYHRQLKSAPQDPPSALPQYNFPLFAGQVFDGTTFEPLGNARILLKLDGVPARMQDMTWQNPCPTFSATSGTYTFWVEPEKAEEAGTPRTFSFTVEASAPDYSGSTFAFEVPLTSERSDRSRLNSTYSLKIQDLFLFKKGIHNPMED